MAGKPDVGIGVDFRHVAVDFLGGVVVSILVSKGMSNAGRVAFVRRRLAFADLLPSVLTSLTAAAAEEEIVIDFVVGGCFRPIEHGR